MNLSPMFTVTASGIHGMGWIATRDIAADTCILDEGMAFSFPMAAVSDPERIDKRLAEVTQQNREGFLALSGVGVTEKLHINGQRLYDQESRRPRPEFAIHLQGTRLNHSCRPNATLCQGTDNSQSVVAMKVIRAGQEITISYLKENLSSTKERNRDLLILMLRHNNGRVCCCELCTSSPAVIQASDERRKSLATQRFLFLQGRLPVLSVLGLPQHLEQEGLFLTLIGTEALQKYLTIMDEIALATKGGADKRPTMNFLTGHQVQLYKLRTKPELNGQTGVIVHELNPHTGRVGVLLDDSADSETPVAVKPDNLLPIK